MASPAWALNGNTGTNPANNFLGTTDTEPLVIKTRGTERLRIDAGGNVGIGTATPAHPLHLAAGKMLRIEGGTSAADGANYFSFGGNGAFGIDAFGIPNGRFVVQNSGSVGIGTGNPATRLHVQGASDQQSTLAISRSDNNKFVRLGVGGAGVTLEIDPSSFFTVSNNNGLGTGATLNGVELLRVTASGAVGIGTGSPRSALEIARPAPGPALTLTNTSGGGGGGVGLAFNTYPPPANASASSVINVIDDGNYGNSISISTRMPGAATNSLVERILIRSDGNIGIGLSERDERDGEPSSTLVVAGNVKVTGDILLSGADCAEHFDACDAILPEPGTVVVIDENGTLRESSHAYDKKVAGVVSGAGVYRHGIVLDKRPEEERIPVALVGKVFCKVSAEFSPVAVGDLLTTSSTPGYAMKAVDPTRAFGAVLGKALKPLQSGLGLVPVLVALQ